MPGNSRAIKISQIRATARHERSDRVAVEAPDNPVLRSGKRSDGKRSDGKQHLDHEVLRVLSTSLKNDNDIRFRKDIGRHNAVDKVVGTLLSRGMLPASHRSGWQEEFTARAEQQGKIVETHQ